MTQHTSTRRRRVQRLTALTLSVPLALASPTVAFAHGSPSSGGSEKAAGAGSSDSRTVGMGNKNDKVTICHATGSTTNPFVVIRISENAAVRGHAGDGHQDGEDIIPVFTYTHKGETKTFVGQNLGGTGAATLANECTVPVKPPPTIPVVPVATPTVTVVIDDKVKNVATPTATVTVVVNRDTPGTPGTPGAPGTPGTSGTPGAPGSNGQPSGVGSGGTVLETPIAGQPVTLPASLPIGFGAATPLAGTPSAQPASGRGSAGNGAAGASALPFTGADTALLAQLALLVIAAGAAAMRFGRRRGQLS